MSNARKAMIALSWLYVLGVAMQFFLAGLGSIALEGWGAHEGLGSAVARADGSLAFAVLDTCYGAAVVSM